MSSADIDETRPQYAALPYRLVNGRVEVLLITSRETRRWVIPKGWPMLDRTPPEAAAQEAFEEAGVTGRLETEAVGSFDYQKRLKTGLPTACRVTVFPLEVEAELDAWPEQSQRQRRWSDWKSAAEAVSEPDLASLIRAFGRARSEKRWFSGLFGG